MYVHEDLKEALKKRGGRDLGHVVLSLTNVSHPEGNAGMPQPKDQTQQHDPMKETGEHGYNTEPEATKTKDGIKNASNLGNADQQLVEQRSHDTHRMGTANVDLYGKDRASSDFIHHKTGDTGSTHEPKEDFDIAKELGSYNASGLRGRVLKQAKELKNSKKETT